MMGEFEDAPVENPSMSEEDLQMLNQVHPNFLRQWIIEKMLENGALEEFQDIRSFIHWAGEMEKYIVQGEKSKNAEVP